VLIPKIIQMTYPDLSADETEQVRQQDVADSVLKNSDIEIKETGGKQFIRDAGRFINIDDLSIDLIDTINPFQKAFEIISKSVTKGVFKSIKDAIESTRITITEEEVKYYYPKAVEFKKTTGKDPNINAINPMERKMAEAVIYLKNLKRKQGATVGQ
nr:hypothetical protein [Candidatus Gastranaerophilales bacterium]